MSWRTRAPVSLQSPRNGPSTLAPFAGFPHWLARSKWTCLPLGTTDSFTLSFLLFRIPSPVGPMLFPSTGTSGIPFTFSPRCLSSLKWFPGSAAFRAAGHWWLLFTPSRHGSRTFFTGPGTVFRFLSTHFPSSPRQAGYSTPTHPFIVFTCGDYEVGPLLQGYVAGRGGYDIPGSQGYYHQAVPRYLGQILLLSFFSGYSP